MEHTRSRLHATVKSIRTPRCEMKEGAPRSMARRKRRECGTLGGGLMLRNAALLLAAASLLPRAADAGLTVGGVTSTDACYAALRSSQRPGDNVVDKDGYVDMINELSGGAITAFQKDEATGNWGYYPVSDFQKLPKELQQEFYKHACGGPFVICDSAFLYTDGTGERNGAPDPQEEVYLYQVCIGVEEAIEEARPPPTPPPTPETPAAATEPTPRPTLQPTPPTGSPILEATEPETEKFTGYMSMRLNYTAAVVSAKMSTEELQSPDSPERMQLLGAMYRWSQKAAKDYFNMTGGGESAHESAPTAAEGRAFFGLRLRGRRGGRRELLVTPMPMVEKINGPEYMTIVDTDCTAEVAARIDGNTSHCILVTTNLTLEFRDEPADSVRENEAITFFVDEFESDVGDGTFHGLISNYTRESVLVMYVLPGDVYFMPVDAVLAVPTAPVPTVPVPTVPVPTAPPDQGNRGPSINGASRTSIDAPPEDTPSGKKGNVAGIVSGVVIGLGGVLLIAFFAYRRANPRLDDTSKSGSEDSSLVKKRSFIATNDLEGGKVNRGLGAGDGYSSRDEFSSSDSHSSGSMQSYSGSESSGSSRSRSSRSGYGSKGGGSSKSSASSSYYSSSYASSRSASDGARSLASETDGAGPHGGGGGHAPPHEGGPPPARSAAAPALGRKASRGSDSEGSRSLYSNQESTGSSVDGASDPNLLSGAASGGDVLYRVDAKRMAAADASPARSRSTTTGEDDSSAGSSGWDSSDGESSVESGSVDSYDPNTIRTGDLDSSASGGPQSYPSSGESTMEDARGMHGMNPAVNPVVQHGVTMIPIEGANRVEDSMTQLTPVSEGSRESVDTSMDKSGLRRDQPPMGEEIQEAIDKGNWASVAATAAIMASSSDSSVEEYDDATRDSMSVDNQGLSGKSMAMSTDSATQDEDDVRAAEIDQLVESGNWDGVVAVAARYADEADEADVSLARPLRRNVERGSSRGGGSALKNESATSRTNSEESAGSVSVETADASSLYSNTTRDSLSHDMSHTTYSVGTSADDETMTHDGASTVGASTIEASSSGTDSRTPPDTTTHTSSISSVSGAITSSMISGVSSVDPQEKRQMNAYRAEVEALVRRVVPDEIDNVDDIMVQFSGREEELIETLRAMQEKSIAQRARAAVQRSAKKEAGRTGRDSKMDDESSLGQSFMTDGQSYTTEGDRSATTGGGTTRSGSVSPRGSRGRTGSIVEEFEKGGDPDYSSSGSSSGSSTGSSSGSSSSQSDGSSYFSSSGSSRSGSASSAFSESQVEGSIGIISVQTSEHGDDLIKSSTGLGAAIDASDWRAVGEAVENLQGTISSSQPSHMTGMSQDTRDELDNMIDDGNWSAIINATSGMANKHTNGTSSGSADDLD